jgi:hypothetical protein
MRTKNLRCLKKILTVLAVAGALFLATGSRTTFTQSSPQPQVTLNVPSEVLIGEDFTFTVKPTNASSNRAMTDIVSHLFEGKVYVSSNKKLVSPSLFTYPMQTTATIWYYDLDSDGFGRSNDYKVLATPQGHYSALYPGDCDDTDPTKFPGNPWEVPDGKDNNCNGLVDEPLGNTPDLTITKLAADTPWPIGGSSLFTMWVTNLGDGIVPAGTNITVTENLPLGLTLTGITTGPGWTCSPTSGAGPLVITCSYVVPTGGLAPGAILQPLVFTVTVEDSALFQNYASVTATLQGNVLQESTGNNISCTQISTEGSPACVTPPSGMVFWAPLDDAVGQSTVQDLAGGNNGTTKDVSNALLNISLGAGPQVVSQLPAPNILGGQLNPVVVDPNAPPPPPTPRGALFFNNSFAEVPHNPNLIIPT